MIWTILSFLCVLGTKLATSLRLKDLRAQLEKTQPRIDELRTQLATTEDEAESLRLKEQGLQQRLTHLKDVVRGLESNLKGPDDAMAQERLQVLHTAETST
jgi:predicted  nucleic acid-binding Zn-ribbon protein